MHHLIKDFYKESSGSSGGSFHKVIALQEKPNISWEEISKMAPALPRGWYELAHLTAKDRIEFTRDFWISKLAFHIDLQHFIVEFFSSFEDVYVMLAQKKFDDPFEAHLVYVLKNDEGFFKGSPPILEKEIVQLQSDFNDVIFPQDYLAFLQIHNGFCKTTDCTGILSSKSLKKQYEKFQKDTDKLEEVTNTKGISVNPDSLIPFYESFGMPFFQCFYKDWYPEDEMGNVYYSGNNNTISDIQNLDPGCEAMAFPTFSDWLIFYLETIA